MLKSTTIVSPIHVVLGIALIFSLSLGVDNYSYLRSEASVQHYYSDEQLEKWGMEATQTRLLEENSGDYQMGPIKFIQMKEEEARKKAEEEEAAKQAALAQSYSSGNYTAVVSYFGGDEESARQWIMQRESGGNYDATNGRYIGAYQLDSAYLNGDYSQENQDRTAQQYVENRYGSWQNAVAFWQANGWY